MKTLYYESHITIEPVFGELLLTLKNVCSNYGFRVANLIMRKEDGAEVISKDDTFCSAKSDSYEDLHTRMLKLLQTLNTDYGYKIYRYKIESVVLDSKIEDTAHMFVTT